MQADEEEVYALVGPQAEEYHLQAALAQQLLHGAPGVAAAPAEAAELFAAAADAAMAAMKAPLGMKYLELASEAEALAEGLE